MWSSHHSFILAFTGLNTIRGCEISAWIDLVFKNCWILSRFYELEPELYNDLKRYLIGVGFKLQLWYQTWILLTLKRIYLFKVTSHSNRRFLSIKITFLNSNRSSIKPQPEPLDIKSFHIHMNKFIYFFSPHLFNFMLISCWLYGERFIDFFCRCWFFMNSANYF